MSHQVRVNAGYHSVTLPNGKIYTGPVDVVLSDDEFDQISSTAFDQILTDLGYLPDPAIDASFATDQELTDQVADVVRKPAAPTAIAGPTGGTTIDAEARASIDSILTVLRDRGVIA